MEPKSKNEPPKGHVAMLRESLEARHLLPPKPPLWEEYSLKDKRCVKGEGRLTFPIEPGTNVVMYREILWYDDFDEGSEFHVTTILAKRVRHKTKFMELHTPHDGSGTVRACFVDGCYNEDVELSTVNESAHTLRFDQMYMGIY